MKTIVELFVIEETAELIYDNEKLTKWNELVDELGLQGQTTLAKPNKSPIPFMHLKTSLKNVFDCLCPRRVKVEEYSATPIPVEILDLIALSKREKYFEEVQIWYDDKSPDPACIGVNYEYYSVSGRDWKNSHPNKESAQKEMDEKGWEGKPAQTCNSEIYLLGKWADVKHSFEELKEMATKRFMAKKENEYLDDIKKAQRGLDDLKSEAFEKFN